MAAGPALIVHEDGMIEATPELKQKLHLTPGTRLELVGKIGREVRFRVPSSPRRTIKSWRDMAGFLADFPVDLNEERKKERQRELERDTHWRD